MKSLHRNNTIEEVKDGHVYWYCFKKYIAHIVYDGDEKHVSLRDNNANSIVFFDIKKEKLFEDTKEIEKISKKFEKSYDSICGKKSPYANIVNIQDINTYYSKWWVRACMGFNDYWKEDLEILHTEIIERLKLIKSIESHGIKLIK